MVGASAVSVVDANGKLLLQRDFRGDCAGSLTGGGGNPTSKIAERFAARVLHAESGTTPPVFIDGGISFCWVALGDVYLVGVTRSNSNATLLLLLLRRVGAVLAHYLQDLNEETIRDNSVLAYELLDECIDNGLPQTTEVRILGQYIKGAASIASSSSNSQAPQPPPAATAAVSWRPEGIKHKKNEVFLDVIERVEFVVSADGQVLRSEVSGELRMKSFLSGMPVLQLGLNDKLLLDANNGGASSGRRSRLIELSDARFHQCVQLGKFQQDRTISFTPPDGEFVLMSYRVPCSSKPLIWLSVRVEDGSSSGSGSSTALRIFVKATAQFKPAVAATNVSISIPVPPDAGAPQVQQHQGKLQHQPQHGRVVWTLRRLQGQRECSLAASFSLPSVREPNADAFKLTPVTVAFDIPYYTVSGITVRYLKIVEQSGYQALPWVRYITQNGTYEFRMA